MNSTSRRHCGSKERIVTVHLLDKTTVQVPIQHKTRYGDILIKIRKHLNLSSSNLFGLACKTEHGDFEFVDPLRKVWKKDRLVSQSTEASASSHCIYLQVQYYVDNSYQFRSESDRKHYYLQMKENFLKYGFNYPDERCFLLASYAMHADDVDWRSFDPREYFPAWVLKSYGTQFVRKHMPTIRPEKLTAYQAMSTYINELSRISPYIYNMALCRLQSCKADTSKNARIGICQEGLQIYEVDSRGYLNFLNSCVWSHINSIHFSKRKLTILVQSKRLEFYAHSEDWCRTLCRMLKNSLNVYMGIDNGACLFQNEERDNLCGPIFRETYIYSDERDLELEYEHSLMGTLRSSSTMKCDPDFISADDISLSDIYTPCDSSNPATRFSIISRTSSTTTSGIVSDRTCLSTEASEEDLISSNTRPSSCDSLLDSEYEMSSSQTRLVTVQRAISEPSKNFEHLGFKVKRSPKCLPRRALSDETIDEHDYENIAVVRKVLGLNTATPKKPVKSAHGIKHSSKSADYLLGQPSRSQSSKNINNNVHRQTGLVGPVSHHSSVSAPLPFQNRYSLLSNSPSMEKLLMDYTPPPSYNENHARQREMLLAASGQVSEDSISSMGSGLALHNPVRTSTPVLNKTAKQRPIYMKQRSESHKSPLLTSNKTDTSQPGAASATTKCTCLKLSHPEIDKLRIEVNKDHISLPMISALCNDKELLQASNKCTCKPHSPRPTSWHCDSNNLVFSFPPTSATELSAVAQVCR